MSAKQPVRPHSDRRARELARIHVAAKQLNLDRETYEALLLRVAGVRSAADLTPRGRGAVIAELERLGAPRPRSQGAPKGEHPMLAKVGALLTELQAPWSYADAIARQMFGVERVAFLRGQPQRMRAVIAALDARRLKLQQLEGDPQ